MTPKQYKLIEDLYYQLRPLLLSYAASALSSESQAEEAVQDTFQIACQRIDIVSSHPNPQGWVFTTLKNVISNEMQQRLRDTRVITDTLGAHIDQLGHYADRINVDLIYENVADTEEFRLIKAIALDGRSMLELSRELGISIPAVKKRAQRAREYLQKRLKEQK